MSLVAYEFPPFITGERLKKWIDHIPAQATFRGFKGDSILLDHPKFHVPAGWPVPKVKVIHDHIPGEGFIPRLVEWPWHPSSEEYKYQREVQAKLERELIPHVDREHADSDAASPDPQEQLVDDC